MSAKGGTKKGKKAKEDLERQMREEEERLAVEELQQGERDAEDRMRRECEQRDQIEQRENKRVRKEEAASVLAERERCILMLSRQVNDQVRLFAQARSELEQEVEALSRHKEQLEDHLASTEAESGAALAELRAQNAAYAEQVARDADALATLAAERAQLAAELDTRTDTLRAQLAQAEAGAREAEEKRQERVAELTSKARNLERELEKTAALNRTLQELIEGREIDDKKNVMLMQLLNNQLDENKQRAQQALDEERERSRELQARLAQTELQQSQLQEEASTSKRDKDEMLRQVERDLMESKQKLEQVKFDARFVHHELSKYKAKLEQQQDDYSKKSQVSTEQGEKMKVFSQNTTQHHHQHITHPTHHPPPHHTQTDMEAAVLRIEDLESVIRKKDRDHFDKVTFLNAQISNNRTIISQLQMKFQKEKETRLHEIAALNEELSSKSQRLSAAQSDLDKKKLASGDAEVKLSSDIAILKTTVFQLQSALVEKERDMEKAASDKEEEVRRLRKKLDENFIPHRRDGEGSAEAHSKPLEAALSEKISNLTRDLEVRSRVALDTEARLNAQVSATNQVVESLQIELKAKDDEYSESVKALSVENARMKVIIEDAFVPDPLSA